MRNYLAFLWDCFRLSFVGDWRYHLWMTILTVITLTGVYAYCQQLAHGLITTGMTDQVSWGLYIANFTYLVGLAAAAVMVVIPVYIYRNMHLHDVVIFGELLAVAVIVMCLLFVTVDLGRPDRFMHLFWRFNFPMSMLTWDVIALNGYLLLNMHICGYLIYCAYCRRMPRRVFYIPFVFVAIAWAVSIHTVTAFLYVGLGGRPFWNSAIIAPRFLASAFAAGPAFIILTLQIVRRFTSHHVSDEALLTLQNDHSGLDDHQRVPAGLRSVHRILHRFDTRRVGPLPLFRAAWPPRPGTVDLDGDQHESRRDRHIDAARLARADVAVHRLRAGDRRNLDREGHGADRARLHPFAAGRDRRILAYAARDPDLFRHLGLRTVALHHLRPRLRAGVGG